MAQNVSEKSTSKVPSGKSCANEKAMQLSSSSASKGLSPATKTAASSANASVAGMSKPEP